MWRAVKKWVCCGKLVLEGKESAVCQSKELVVARAAANGEVAFEAGRGLWAGK